MKRHDLTDAFERGALDPAAFHHREHLEVAWTLLCRYGRAAAAERMNDGIRRLAARAGRPDKFDAALTHAWMGTLDDARAGLPAGASFDDLLSAHPRLLDRRAVEPVRGGR